VSAPNAVVARELVAGARRIVVLTGAGISTASGIPDFRGPEGIWTKDPAAEMLSSYQTWLSDPEVRKAAWRSRALRSGADVQPNEGHRALLALERRGALLLLVTQNIDGLHQLAGTSPELIVEIHGSSADTVCLRCRHRQPIGPTLARVRRGDDDPTCLEVVDGAPCGGMLKSAVISFGQSLVATDLERAERAAEQCDLLVAVGSTLGVFPAAGLVPIAKSTGAKVVIVNGQPTEMDALADAVVDGDITAELPRLIR
jgi:NAD-dependent protein deacetylase/lipoamidase